MIKQLLSFFFVATLLGSFVPAFSQGCVCIRQMGCTPSMGGVGGNATGLNKGDVLFNTSYRWFKSFRHFRGLHEEADRVANGTEVINKSHSLDFNFTYALTNRWMLNATVPFVYHYRSSLYEHGRTQRHSSESMGLADVRFSAGYWLFKPEYEKGNIAIGAGVKVPTGNWNAQDDFYNVGPGGSSQVRNVDQSIQPGDGGWGFSAETQGFVQVYKKFYGYGNAFYLFNPKETNGARTFRETLSPTLANEAIMSVADQYLARGGFSYLTNWLGKTAFSLGARYEGVPVNDIIGGRKGFRRPGSILSVEPGITWRKGKHTATFFMPIALRRNRPQSVTDKETEALTNIPRNGDAAFADYAISIGNTFRLAKK